MNSLQTILAICTLLILQGCGSSAREKTFAVERAVAPAHIPDNYVDPRAAIFVGQFFSDLRKFDRKVVMPESLQVTFKENHEFLNSEVGYCKRRWVERKVYAKRINIHSVELSDLLLKKDRLLRQTIYHELGHCILDLRHDEFPSKRSIMSKIVFENEGYSEEDWQQLVVEMLAPKNMINDEMFY